MCYMFTIDELTFTTENQTFERKSIKIEPKALAIPIVAFANADGGTIFIGTSNNGDIEGVDDHIQKINELLRVPFDFCTPSIKIDFEFVACIDCKGIQNRILVLTVHQSSNVHTNQADEVFYRVGDKSKKLSFNERMQLLYDKGDMIYEDTPVRNAGIEDIDMEFVSEYAKMIGYTKTPLQFLEECQQVITKGVNDHTISVAAIMLFGKNPQKYFPRARMRFIKYTGTEERTGSQMNVIKDVIFEGTILHMLRKSIDFVGTQIREFTRLEKGGLFETTPEYPEFVWNEIIINAVAHRDYSIKGTDIHIKMFDDRIAVESPGRLPGLVRINNIRNMHFSRNPKIAAFLKEYKYVKEFGEGVDRMFREMYDSGLPDPEYQAVDFMTYAVVKNNFKKYENPTYELPDNVIDKVINEVTSDSDL